MNLRMSSSGLVVDDHGPLGFGLGLIDAVLRGVGQVMLQNNSCAGTLFPRLRPA